MAPLLLASARRAQNDDAGARAILEPLARAHPALAPAQYQFGSALAALGETRAAISAFERAAHLDPDNAAIWRALGDRYTLAGDAAAADDAYAQSIKASVNDPELLTAATALCENRLASAERLLRDFMQAHPTDVAAIRMLAETASRLAAYEDAENLLARALELAPSFTAARHNYAVMLNRQFKSDAALEQIDLLLEKDPGNPAYRTLRAAVLSRIGEYDEAIESYEILLRDQPAIPKAWMSYGTHSRPSDGRTTASPPIERASRFCRNSANLTGASRTSRRSGSATVRSTPCSANSREPISRTKTATTSNSPWGKALEDKGEFAQSFEH